ncbi:MAG: hypothetical protein WD071_06845 [Pseudohongiella sp.]|uniref:hypothetical protein n=1 Tax=Pseudohongiella sp. TaxID=1979412 RepID=UPI0034A0289A
MTSVNYGQAIITISAVLLGFVLGQLSDYFNARSLHRRKGESLRALIRIELEQNARELNLYWSSILDSMNGMHNDKNEFKYALMASEVSEAPFPQLYEDAWLSNLGDVPSYFDYQEIESIWSFYKKLGRLNSLYAYFVNANEDRKTTARDMNARGDVVIGTLMGNWDFTGSVSDHAKEFKTLIEDVIQGKYDA